MKKIITLGISLLFILNGVLGQKIDYDNSSKWFLGFNVGGTWHSSDVKNDVNGGWGVTLGRSFNYNYGRRMSFDIRGRYLGGIWYGQDYKTTDLSNYNPGGGSTADFPLQQYKDSLGYAINNFQTELHSLSMELVLHANGVRERSGWDPYIFGGIGLKWYQTMGDLTVADSLYDYNSISSNINSASLSGVMDNIYETALPGSDENKFTLGVMPSLGFGIGYQVGKRVSLGLEHKTTFTGGDDWDGFVSDAGRFKQDLYHYTSFYVQFRFRTGGHTGSGGGNNVNNIDNYNNNNLTNCPSPTITFRSPSADAQLVSGQMYLVTADIYNVTVRDGITFLFNGVSNTNFTFNAATGRLESNVVLAPGANSFEIKASNNCGNASSSISINYQACQAPILSITSPTTNNTTVSSSVFSLSAQVQHVKDKTGMTFTQNGQQLSTFNVMNGGFQGDATLVPGANVFVISATNACGTVSETITVNYQVCLTPAITFTSPSVNNTTVTNPNFQFSAQVQNMSSTQGLTVTQNGRAIGNMSFVNNTLQGNVTLSRGANVFVVTATNSCGTTTQTITVNYNSCIPPLIVFTAPTSNNTTVTSASFTLNAQVQNVTNRQSITLKRNGVAVTNFTYTNGVVQHQFNLSPGANIFVITATNDCGTSTETVTVNYNNCVPPVVNFTSPASNNTTVTNASFSLSAQIQNVNNAQGITLTRNGAAIGNFSFTNNTLQSNVTLTAGPNVFVVTATNSCGTDSETITVNYNNCVPPVITFSSPVANNTTVTSASFSLSAQIQNVTSGQGVTVTQNGRAIGNMNYNSGNFQGNVSLSPGANVFVITVSNSCGSDTETITVNYDNCVPPAILNVSPVSNNANVNNPNLTLSVQLQGMTSAQGIVLSHNGNPINNFTFNSGTISASVTLTQGVNTFIIQAVNSCGSLSESMIVNYKPLDQGGSPEQMITICHRPPGNPTNTQTIEIPLSAWPAHQAHGDVLGECPQEPAGNGNGNGNQGGNGNNTPEEKITICHHPPGNPNNTQTLEIPLSAWPAHQAHGDVLGTCPEEPAGNGNGNGNQGGNGNAGGNGNNSGNNGNSGNNTPEEKITICHHPPGNPDNTQTLEIPLSAWPAHQAHGDVLGTCPEEPAGNGNGNGNAGGNGNNSGNNGNSGNNTPEEKITICHHPPGNPDNTQTLEIPLSAWAAHQAHGDILGTCPEAPAGNGNGNGGGNSDNNGQGSSNTSGQSNGSGFNTGNVGNNGSGNSGNQGSNGSSGSGSSETGNGNGNSGNGSTETGNGNGSSGNGSTETGNGNGSSGIGSTETGNGNGSSGNGSSETGNGNGNSGNGSSETGNGNGGNGNGGGNGGGNKSMEKPGGGKIKPGNNLPGKPVPSGETDKNEPKKAGEEKPAETTGGGKSDKPIPVPGQNPKGKGGN